MKVDQIIKKYGSPTGAKNALGFTLQTFRNWQRSGIPLRSQQIIQYLTNGELRAECEATRNGKKAGSKQCKPKKQIPNSHQS